MKKLIIISIVLIIALVLVGCGQNDELETVVEVDTRTTVTSDLERETVSVSAIPNMLMFSSLEDFLHSYLAIGDGRGRGAFVGEYSASRTDATLTDVLDAVDLLSMENFYIPVNIPEGHKLFRIAVYENRANEVIMWFLPEEYLGSEWWEVQGAIHQYGYQFSFTRNWNVENPMVYIMEQFGATEEDLIDGKYLFDGRNWFIWASGTELLNLRAPMPQVTDITNAGPLDLVHFTEVYVLDMTDEDAIRAFLGGTTKQALF